jgi:CheY-like chemotaxis protein
VRKQPPGAGILIVEDHAELRETLASFLEDLGYRVARAANGQDALRQLRHAPLPGLIFLDLIMPIMNGWVFRAEQRQDPRLSAIPMVLISGVDDLSYQARVLNAAAFLGKPVDLNSLVLLAVRYCA